LFVAIAVVYVCAQNPQISDDFSANAIILESHGNFKNRFQGIVYESYSTKRQRIDVDHVHERPVKVELLRLFASHTEYEVQGTSTCRKHGFNESMHAAFAWLANAKKGHECHASQPNKTVGVSWSVKNEHLTATACVSTANQNIPLWVTYVETQHKIDRRIDFSNFIAKNPDDSYFKVPSGCPN